MEGGVRLRDQMAMPNRGKGVSPTVAQVNYTSSGESGVLCAERQVSLCELLDRVLNKGAVLNGEIVISIAGIELLYVGVGLMVSSV